MSSDAHDGNAAEPPSPPVANPILEKETAAGPPPPQLDDDDSSENLSTTTSGVIPAGAGVEESNAAEPSWAVASTAQQAPPGDTALSVVGPVALAALEVDDDVRPDCQLSPGVAAMAVEAVARLRRDLRLSHALLAKRLGVVLISCSCFNVLTVIVVRVNDHGELYHYMTGAFSISAFVLHVALNLAHGSMRLGCAAHFGLLVLPTVINGVFCLARRDFASAVYSFLWLLFLFPLLGWGLHRLLRAALELEQTRKDTLSQRTTTVVVSSGMPIIYFLTNGLLCVAFENESHCATRVTVNYAAILAVLGNSVLFVLLTLQPASLKQVIELDIPPRQLVAVCFHGLLLSLALALHSQNESFGPVTPAVEYMGNGAGPCLVFFFVAFAFNLTRQSRAVMGASIAATEPAAAVGAQQFGLMVPHRIFMAAFTALNLVFSKYRVGEIIHAPFAPLSIAATVLHISVRAEDAAVSWPAKLHFAAHASGSMIYVERDLSNGNFGGVLTSLVFLTVIYPSIFKAATRFCSSVRAHGNIAATKLAATSFVAFWSAVVPGMLYLGADTLGTLSPLSLFSTALTCCVSRSACLTYGAPPCRHQGAHFATPASKVNKWNLAGTAPLPTGSEPFTYSL